MPTKCTNCGFEIDPVNESQNMACPRCGEEIEAWNPFMPTASDLTGAGVDSGNTNA
jgi:predicted  nucleic acid-binding Zn-ribbon protein